MDNLSKYLEDISFICWVFEPSPELDLKWAQFGKKHPEEQKNILMARKIILQFRTEAKTLSEADKILLFSRVLKQIEEKQESKKAIRIYIGIAKYAAIAILFFSIGALLFYQPSTVTPEFYSFNSEEHIHSDQAQLIRSNGENVILKNQRPVIKYQNQEELVINQDTLKLKKTDLSAKQALNQLIIPYGKTSELLLPDGTRVFMNAGSRLAYPDQFTGDTREVMLSGEAFFDVKTDAKHPFIVLVNDLRIKDLGTRFNVSAYAADSRIETVLVEGKVSIRDNNARLFTKATELIPGQLAAFDKQTSQITVTRVNVDDYTLWTQGLIRYETADLRKIVKTLERFYNIQFRFEDPMLETLKISGKLELKEDRTEVLERIARTASVRITKEGDNFYTIMK
ncbi:MAG: FecR domain-containing protein [Prolixibacteraceae bacterium]|nr:FecR domain-containing protein [Prolixibacteraceae bacterium]